MPVEAKLSSKAKGAAVRISLRSNLKRPSFLDLYSAADTSFTDDY